MEKFLKIKNQTQKTADLYIYGDIVSSEWDRWELEDVAPEGVKNFLDEVKGKDLNIYINSGGGSVFAGLAIYNMLKRHEGFKTVHVDGVAASISSIIALAGDKVIVPSNAFLMIHKPWTMAAGNAEELRKQAEDLDRIEQGLLAIYEENLAEGADMETIKQMVAAETWISGSDAINYFNVETSQSLEAVACVKSEFFNSYKSAPEELKEAKEISVEEKTSLIEEEKNKLLMQIELL